MPPEIKSSIGSRSFTASSSSGQRVVEIPDGSDESGDYNENINVPHPHHQEEGRYANVSPYHQPAPQRSISETEATLRQARQEKRTGEGRISPGAKQRVEFLSNIGRLSKDVKVDGTIFSLRTLKNKEMRDSIMVAASAEKVDQMFEARTQQLARAIYAIDGNEINMILGDGSVEARVKLVDDLDENLISFLYSEFAALNKEAAEKFDVKSDKDMKEVAEDIKK